MDDRLWRARCNYVFFYNLQLLSRALLEEELYTRKVKLYNILNNTVNISDSLI